MKMEVPTTSSAPAQGAQTPATPAAPPASQPAGQTAAPAAPTSGDSATGPSGAETQFLNDLRGQLQDGLGRTTKCVETFRQDEKKPDPEAKPPEAQIPVAQPPAAAAPAEEIGDIQETNPDVKSPVTEPVKAVFLEKFGKEFSTMEIEAALEGFNYYHPRALKLQEDAQRVQADAAQLQQERAKLAELSTAPEMAFIAAMKSNPDLLAKVTEIVREFDAQAVSNYNQATANAQHNQENERQKAEIEALKQRDAERQQQELQTYVSRTIDAVDRHVSKVVDDLGKEGITITPNDLKAMTDAATALVQVGKLQYTAKDLASFYVNHITAIAEKARAVKTSALGQYRERKEQLPPPPPTGGAAQQLASPRVRDFREARAKFAEGIEMTLQRMK